MAVYYIKHTKADAIKFVGHLDLQKAIQRNITRANIGVAYSQGFNPHMLMSSAQPLSVGVSSDAEYLMVELETEKSEGEILADLNRTSAEGIRYTMVRAMGSGTKAPMALLDAVESRISIPSEEIFARALEELLQGTEPMPVRTLNKKKQVREKDIRPLILPGAAVSFADGYTDIRICTLAGSRDHLNLEHFLMYLREHLPGIHTHRFTPIRRLEMYTRQNGLFIPLGEV